MEEVLRGGCTRDCARLGPNGGSWTRKEVWRGDPRTFSGLQVFSTIVCRPTKEPIARRVVGTTATQFTKMEDKLPCVGSEKACDVYERPAGLHVLRLFQEHRNLNAQTLHRNTSTGESIRSCQQHTLHDKGSR